MDIPDQYPEFFCNGCGNPEQKMTEITPKGVTDSLHFCSDKCLQVGIPKMENFCLKTCQRCDTEKLRVKETENRIINPKEEMKKPGFFEIIREAQQAMREVQQTVLKKGEVLENSSMYVTMALWFKKTQIFRPSSEEGGSLSDDFRALAQKIESQTVEEL